MDPEVQRYLSSLSPQALAALYARQGIKPENQPVAPKNDFYSDKQGQRRSAWLNDLSSRVDQIGGKVGDTLRYFGGPGFSEFGEKAVRGAAAMNPAEDVVDAQESSAALVDRVAQGDLLGSGREALNLGASMAMTLLPGHKGAIDETVDEYGRVIRGVEPPVQAITPTAVPEAWRGGAEPAGLSPPARSAEGLPVLDEAAQAVQAQGQGVGALDAMAPPPAAAVDLSDVPAAVGHNGGPALDAEITGSFNPFDEVPFQVNGKDPKDWTDAEWMAADEKYGAEGMIGRTSAPVPITDNQGRTFQIPGGFEGTLTYRDMLNLKSQGIDPSELPEDVHKALHDKMVRSVAPQVEGGTDADVWNGLIFGLTSPNNPLFPNQLSQSRLRLRGGDTGMLDELSSMIDWEPGETVSKERRMAANAAITKKLGLDAAPNLKKGKTEGGLGVSGSSEYTNIAELAKMFKEKPEFFRKRPDEAWEDYVERLNSQTRGLSAKTGSFGSVWQDPVNAGISAVDRHMAQIFADQGGLFEDAAHRAEWERRGLALWNENNPDRQFESFAEMARTPGTGAHVGDMLLGEVNKHSSKVLRDKKGNINKALPDHLKNVDWVREPAKVEMIGENYKRALQENARRAEESGQGLFSSQWMLWDRQRRRLETHENMMPALSKFPAPTTEQLRASDLAHRKTGHKTYGKETDEEGKFRLKPTRGGVVRPEEMAYFREAAGSLMQGKPPPPMPQGAGRGATAATMAMLNNLSQEELAMLAGGGAGALMLLQTLRQGREDE